MKNENKEGRAIASPITLPSTKCPLTGPKQWTCAAKDCTCHLKPRIELWTGGKFKQYNFVCSHIPLREDQMRDAEFNVHGHLHQNRVRNYPEGHCPCPDGCNGCFIPEFNPRYINVCVEHWDYSPVHLDEIRELTRHERNF